MAYDVRKAVKEKSTKNNSGNFFDVRKSIKQKNLSKVGTYLETAIGNFIKRNDSYLSGYNNKMRPYIDTDPLDWAYDSTSADWLSSLDAQRGELEAEAADIRSWLDDYKDFLSPDYYSSVNQMLDGYTGQYKGVISNATDMNKYWSQWEDESAYNKSVADQRDYNNALNYDLEAGKAEIDALQAKYNEAFGASSQLLSNPGNVNYDSVKSFYETHGDLGALSRELSEKQAYYNLAERLQSAERLASVGDKSSENYDPEFDVKSQYQKGVYNDTTYDYINGDEAFRKQVNQNHDHWTLGGFDTDSEYERAGYDYMSDKEIALYNYYYNTEGKEKAQEYLNTIEGSLQAQLGDANYSEMKGNTLREILFGFEVGLDQFVSGIAGIFSDGYTPPSATQVAGSLVREDLADDGFKIFGNSIGQVFYDVTTTTSNMLPSILVGATVNPIAGAGLLGVSAAGNAKVEMLNLGYTNEQATTYGIMVGAAEAGMEYLLGGIGTIGGKLSGKAVTAIASKVDNALARVAIKLGNESGSLLKAIGHGTATALGKMGSEAFEEGLQTVIETWLKEIATNVDWESPSIDEVLYSSLLGALSAFGLEGAGVVAGEVGTYQSGKTVQKIEGGVAKLQDIATNTRYFSADSVAYKIASKINAQTDAYTIGRLLSEVGGTISEQNLADIINGLTKRSVSERDAKKIAKKYQDFLYSEMNMTEEQAEILKKLSPLADSLRDDIIGANTTVYQRTRAYSDLMKLADDVANRKKDKSSTKASEASTQGSIAVPAAETSSEKESATESDFEGKTIDLNTGKEVSVAEIVSNENGNLMVRLDNGETVNARDLSYATSEEGVLYEMVAKMGVDPKTAMALVKAYNPSSGVKAQTYAIDIPLAYHYGKVGYKKGLDKLNLTPEQSATAYVLGRDDVKASGRTWSDTSRKTPETNRSKAADDGIIYDGFELDEDSLTDIQKASLAGVRTIAKMSPTLEIHMFESVVENGKKYAVVNGKKVLAPNGFFRNGNEIYIDINAGKGTMGAMLYTASHEIVHFIAENSFEDFQALSDFLFEHYGENNVPVDALIKREMDILKKSYEAEGKDLPGRDVLYMKAYEEVVANAMSKMLADPTSYEKLAKLKSENLSLWEKIGEAIKRMLDKLKSMLGIYEGRTPDAMAAHYVDDFSAEVYNKLQDLYLKAFVNAEANYQASIGSRNLEDFADAKNTEGDSLFQYKAMEADEDTYREMLKKWGKMTDSQISNLFLTIDNAMELIKDNLEALDYAWDADIDDRAFSPVKPNSDKLYQLSLDFSTLCRKRILQQMVQTQLQEVLNKTLTREEGIAIRDALIVVQEEGRQIEVACALCYVESARMKSPEQIRKFMDNKEKVIKEFFAGKSGGSMKEKLKKAETDAREKLHKENPNGIKGKDGSTMLDPRTASLKALPKKYADEVRSAKKAAKASYVPTAEEQKLIDVAKGMTVSDFTSPEGLENLAKNYRELFDAYTSFVRNATKSKGIESDTWWRAGDSMQIGDVLIANMNRENGLRSQSWSDFQVIHILDYIAATIELATRNTKEQAYTKVPDFAELMGQTGVMINLSLIPTAKFNGKLEYDSTEGIDYKRSLELRDKYHATVGTICIGINNVQIQMLLGDMTVDYVIPYHKSGMAAHIRKAMHIPTWTEYESYQSEKPLLRADAEKQAKKYGVKLLAESDPNYHKDTLFSEWFDIEEAQQIAKMENANPSDKAKQKKYGVMYGGYMAMQNAANNYLKLCAERGISPKFSHENANFTVEENYWKLLIDRKMVDNITGEVIDQQTIKPIFDEAEIMRILNDELERYPKVKADQEYAIRKVTEAYLSGNLKGGMSSEAIAKIMQTPVDNVSNVNIFASTEGDTLYSVDDDTGSVSVHKIEEMLNAGEKEIYGYEIKSIYKGEPNKHLPSFSIAKPDGSWGDHFGHWDVDINHTIAEYIAEEIAKRGLISTKKSSITSDPDSVSTRSILANALETTAQNDIERNKLEQYKKKIDLIEAEYAKLSEIKKQANEIRFTKGRTSAETKKMKALEFEANEIANRINTYDRQLLNLESATALKNVLQREKKKAYDKAKQEGKESLAKYREKAAQTQRELINRNTESRKKAMEGRHMSDIRTKIKKYKDKLESSLLHPTDRQYIPLNLVNAMIDVFNLIDTDTPLYKPNGELNKAQARRDATKEKLQALKDEYEALKTNSDPMYSEEFDEVIYKYLTKLQNDFKDKSLADMSLSELEEMYEILKSIGETLQDARKVIGWGDASEVYEAGDTIVAEQAEITKQRKDGKRNAAQRASDHIIDLTLSPVRNVERMSGYREKSPLLRLFKDFERGVRKKNMFVMEAYKDFEDLTTGDNAKKYEAAIYNAYNGKKYTDVNGRTFGISKMQMMQTILSYERETANKMHHIEGSGFSFADLDMLRKGKLKEAVSEEYSHRVPSAVDLVQTFIEELANDKWAQDYMAASRSFFDGKAKDAVNETYITLKHRIIARDKNYIPFEVDKNFVVREISAQNDIQQTINSYGMLQDTKDGASQPLIITGLNNILDRHIDQVGNVYGLAVSIRNFNKVWNVRSVESNFGGDPTVQAAIQRNWGLDGTKVITQAVQDLQGARPNTQSELYKKVKSGYISSTFALNLSVVTKQIGSLFSATSMLKWRSPVKMVSNLIYTMANHKKISAEVDKYTASVWMRRQGLSDAELHTLLTQAKKPGFFKWLNKLPTIINPTKWITSMDTMVALSLWRYAKQDTSKRTGLTGEELLKATAEFYDSVIENTQSMTDVLHRPEIQKRSDVVSEAFGMFKTDLYQTAGQLQTALGRYMHNKTKENGAALARTVYSATASAIWGSLMTTLFALLRYKVKQYRDDEDDELTMGSWMERQAFGFFGDVVGYIFPLAGGEFVGLVENIMYGESEDVVDSLALTAINDLYDAFVTIGSAVKDGEMPSAEDWEKLVMKSLQIFGVPANNIKRTIKAIQLHAEDIANGEFFSFEAGKDKTNAQALYDAIMSGNEERIKKAEEVFDDESDIKSAIKQALRDNDPRIKEAAKANSSGDIRSYSKYIDTIVAEGHFDEETVEGAIRAEQSAFNTKINEAAEAKNKGNDEEYKKIVRELRDSYKGIYSQDEIVNLVTKAQKKQLEAEDDKIEESTSIYKASDINSAFESGDTDMALEVIDDLIKTKAANYLAEAKKEAEKDGKRFDERTAQKEAESDAKASLKSSMTSYWKPLYKEAYKSGNTAEKERIERILLASGLYGDSRDVIKTCKGWRTEKD